MITTHPRRYDPSGEAKAREQRRQAELEIEERNKTIPAFMFMGYGFRPRYNDRIQLHIDGPLCPRTDENGEYCFVDLKGEVNKTEVECEVCGFTGKLPYPIEEFSRLARKKYEGRQRYVESGKKIETLDVPFDAIKNQGKDETREIKIKWAQKNGRNTAMIYFIDRTQGEGDKAHIIVDLDREEIRHDAKDERPGNVIAKIMAEFPSTTSEIKYKSKSSSK